LYQCDKRGLGWTVTVSDEAGWDGGGKDKMIDGDHNTGTYWHSNYPNYPCPHWAIIDMKEQIEVARTTTQRRSNGDTKTVQYWVGNDPDPNASTWVKIIEGAYASQTANHTLTLDAAEPTSGRYLKLVLPDTFREIYIAICEVDVFGARY
jgi:hypothetical protein